MAENNRFIITKLNILLFILLLGNNAFAAHLMAGIAKVNITNTEVKGSVSNSLYVKALVLDNGVRLVAIITLNPVAIGEIGSISNEYAGNVRSRIQEDIHIKADNILINASHLQGEGILINISATSTRWKNLP